MKIAIVGAGAAGLAAAYDLAKAGHEVTVFEAGAEVGGLAAGFKDPAWDWALEKFYHHWFYTDHDVLDLIAEIGCAEKVRFYSPTTSLWHGGRIYPMDSPFMGSGLLGRIVNVLKLPDISIFAKMRLGLVAYLVSKWRNGIGLEGVTADEWSEKWIGKAAHNLVWRPMLIGKFSEYYDKVNMAWLWARLYKRTAKLGTYVGGFQAMLEDLADAVRAQGASVRLNTPVEQIAPGEDGGLAITAGGETTRFDRAVVTAGPGLLLKMVPDLPSLDAAYAEKVGALESLGALVLILAIDRQLMADGTYWLNLPAKSPNRLENPFPYLALVEHTNYLPTEHYGGDHLLYLGDYLPRDHEHFQLSEEEIVERFLPSLKLVNPDFSPEWVRKRWLFRVPYAQPVPRVNHSQRIPAIRTPLDGLYFASMSQVYPWDRGTNYAVEIGRRTARMMLEDSAHT